LIPVDTQPENQLHMIKNTIYDTVWVILFALTFSACTREESNGRQDDIAAIKAMSAARAKAFNEERAADIAMRFAEQGALMAPGAPIAFGRQAVERYYQSIFDQYATALESGYEEVEVSGDMAFGRGFAKVRLISNAGDTLFSTAKYINILERQPDGTWLTTHDIWNSDQ